MDTNHEQNLFNHVVWHCQLVYQLDNAKTGVEYAHRDGFLNAQNMLTHIGRSIAKMMAQDFNRYKELLNLELGEMLDCNDPLANYETQ